MSIVQQEGAIYVRVWDHFLAKVVLKYSENESLVEQLTQMMTWDWDTCTQYWLSLFNEFCCEILATMPEKCFGVFIHVKKDTFYSVADLKH